MGLIGNLIIGALITVAGVFLLKYNYQVANNLPISFAEAHLGGGGSYALWKILAILVIIAGITVVFGIYDNILGWLLSPISNAIGGN